MKLVSDSDSQSWASVSIRFPVNTYALFWYITFLYKVTNQQLMKSIGRAVEKTWRVETCFQQWLAVYLLFIYLLGKVILLPVYKITSWQKNN